MAKTRRNRGTRGVSRRRRGGQMDVYGSTTSAASTVGNTASNWLSSIGSGLTNAWNSTKKAVSGAIPSNAAAPAYGGRRKRRGGQPVGFDENWDVQGPAKGGSRRKRRGGQVVGFDDNWKEYGSVGGSRRRRRKH